MSHTCIVPSCNTRRTRNMDKATAIKCFSFPKDPILKSKWLNLCQVKGEQNRKICTKHFKEDDFVDGLKARLMGVQPTRLKKDAVPSLFLNPEIAEENKQKQKQMEFSAYVSKRKISQVHKSKSASNIKSGSIEYLSKLVPIAPKKAPIMPQKHHTINESLIPIKTSIKSLSHKSINSQQTLIPKVNVQSKTAISSYNDNINQLKEEKSQSQKEVSFSLQQIKTLQHDNAIYKKKINTLMENQKKLLSQIKSLETKIEIQETDFVGQVKEAFENVFSSNQIDFLLGQKKHVRWSNDEYGKAMELLDINKQAYLFVKNELKYPLPGITNLIKWTSKQKLRGNTIKKEVDENKENAIVSTIGDESIQDDELMNGSEIYEVKLEHEYSGVNNLEYDTEYNIKENDDEANCGVKYDDDDDDDGTDNIDDHHLYDFNEFRIDDSIHLSMDEADEFHEELIISCDSDDEIIDEGDHSDEDNG